MKILIRNPPVTVLQSSAVDVMVMSVCQSNGCSFPVTGCLGGSVLFCSAESSSSMKKRNFPRLHSFSHRPVPRKIYELCSDSEGRARQMKYRRWANICDAEGAWFDSEAKRNEVSFSEFHVPCSMPYALCPTRSKPNQWPTSEYTCGHSEAKRQYLLIIGLNQSIFILLFIYLLKQ